METPSATERRPTQEERREATRGKVLGAAADGLVDVGFAALTTRVVAQRAGVSQATVMHYFSTREALLGEAVTEVGLRLIGEVSGLVDQPPSAGDLGEAMLDLLWDRFRAPEGLVVGQLWTAAWSSPDLTGAVASFERRIFAAARQVMERVHPDRVGDPALDRLLEITLATMRGLVVLSPITGTADIDARWVVVRPVLVAAAAELARPSS